MFDLTGIKDRSPRYCSRCLQKTEKGYLENKTHFIVRITLLALFCCFLSQAFCEPAKVEGNGVLAFAKHVLFPILAGEG